MQKMFFNNFFRKNTDLPIFFLIMMILIKRGADNDATFTVRLNESISIYDKTYELKVEGVSSKLKHAKI